jgi:RHS repeat-associated protein
LAIANATGTLTSGGSGVLANAAAALTTILYSGEQFDAASGLQYLRARYYDPANGRFTTLDPFFGNANDPQSLHKYSYTHADPINGIDPTGLFEAVVGLIGASANIFRGIINLTIGFDAHWGIGHEIAMSLDYDGADEFTLAELYTLSAELMLSDIRDEMTRGIAFAAQASSNALSSIEELIEWNIEIISDGRQHVLCTCLLSGRHARRDERQLGRDVRHLSH